MDAAGEVLDEVEESGLRPVQVFEAHDAWLLATQCLDEAARGIEEDRAVLELTGPEPGHHRERFGRGVGVRADQGPSPSRSFSLRVLGPVRLEDARDLAHDLRECPVPGALAVGMRPPAQNRAPVGSTRARNSRSSRLFPIPAAPSTTTKCER